ncbi:MAG: efflux transporter periplasmic adaptor subunit [Rhodobiaceae bacterium]|nr:efflux transporter periplasmic adaptor subunit [Rhodobiaceae bacterium]
MNKTTKTAIFVLSALLLWMLSGFFENNSNSSNNNSLKLDSDDDKIIKVKAKKIKAKLKQSNVLIQGRTESSRNVKVASETNGIVKEILVKKGEFVKKNQILCKLSVDSREAKLDEAKALMLQKKLEWDASKVLVEKGYRSQTKAAGSKAAFDASKALVIQMEEELENINIRSPFDGFFNNNLAEVGDFLSIGMPCGQVIDYNPILVIGQVSEQEIKKIKSGVQGFAILSTGEKLEGKLSYVSKTADSKTRTFRVELEISNTNFEIKDGITAELFIPTKKVQAHLIPPSSLTLDPEGKIGVRHINTNNEVIFSGIEIIGDQEELIWVTGLPEQITLITIGQEFVLEGQKVNYTLEALN